MRKITTNPILKPPPSDTTATSLTHIVLELARHPEQIHKLRQELAPHIPAHANLDASNHEIVNLDHLNAVIYETLRLHPPVPTALPRTTPPEGVDVGSVHVPGNMTVWCPQYALGRSK